MENFKIKELLMINKNSFLKFEYKNTAPVTTIIFILYIVVLFLILYIIILRNKADKNKRELRKANIDLLENQEEIYNLAYYDATTSFPNRVKFIKELEKTLEISKMDNDVFAVFFLDLDKFKHINDSLGHDIGDEVLRLLGIRISNLIKNKGFLYKASGDEYFILANNIKERSKIDSLAKEIMEDFKKPYYIKGYNLYLTISIGIAIYPEAGMDVLNIIKNADLALYKAKSLGGNDYYIYGNEIETKGLYFMQLLNELRQSIEKDELILYYQPQVDMETEKLIGFEALVRWNHPTRGLMYPDEFIPLAEESDLIVFIGNYIFKKACIQTKEWITKCGDIIISVNISAKQFQHEDFINEVKNALKISDLDPKYIAIEITETIAIYDMEYTLNILNELYKLGLIVSIDDFGTGYSSLRYLNEMNVDELKIDKSFVLDIEKNPKNKSIAKTIILLAKQFEIRVLAEGIENKEQFDILRNIGCDMAQGYYIGRPIPKEKVCNYIKSYSNFMK